MGPRVRVRASCAVRQWNPGRSWAEYTLSTSLDAQSPALTVFLLAAWHSSHNSYHGSTMTYNWADSLMFVDIHRAT